MLDSAETEKTDAEALGRSFLGHPRGLLTPFGTGTRERFSVLGTQAVLLLFFADSTADGGPGMAVPSAPTTWAGLGLIVVGTGLLRPDVSTMVGRRLRPCLAQGVSAQVVRLCGTIPDALHHGPIGAFAVLRGLAMFAATPWMRRTVHPVH